MRKTAGKWMNAFKKKFWRCNTVAILIPIIALLLFAGCYQSIPNPALSIQADKEMDTLTPSVGRYFAQNANFEVYADSVIIENLPLKDSYITLYKGNRVVVADFSVHQGDTLDSIWVKIAQSHEVQGWLPERTLLQAFIPADSVSQLIHRFSNIRIFFTLCAFTVFIAFFLFYLKRRNRLRVFFLKNISSIYPVFFCIVAAISATIYETIQIYEPEMWQHFYFNPTLSPFKVPMLLSFFLGSLWLLLILLLASIDDIFRQVDALYALFYLFCLITFGIYFYLFFIIATAYYIGYFLLPLMVLLSLYYFSSRKRYRYRCGNCGNKMHKKGVCAHCGAINK